MAHENDEKKEIEAAIAHPRLVSLPDEVQRQVEVLQRLEACRGQPSYGAEQRRGMDALGVSKRSLRRLQKYYRDQGIEGLKRQPRRDEGALRVDDSWREFILESYRKGNRGMRKTSRAQIAKLVARHAAAIGSPDYPSRRTVYRILSAEISQAEQKQKKRSIGWQGDTLQLTTKSGIAIAVEYSNQVWQCDHTAADIVVVDSQGEIQGCPTLTTFIDTYSRCIMEIHLGLEPPSAAVTGLALRHAICANSAAAFTRAATCALPT